MEEEASVLRNVSFTPAMKLEFEEVNFRLNKILNKYVRHFTMFGAELPGPKEVSNADREELGDIGAGLVYLSNYCTPPKPGRLLPNFNSRVLEARLKLQNFYEARF